MKLLPMLLAPVLVSAMSASALGQATTSAKRAATTKPAASAPAQGACAKLPEMSPKIPALPAGLSCAKHLYTITTVPVVKLDYISPLEGKGLAESLGIVSSTFSLDYIDTKIGTGEMAAPHKFYTLHYTGYLLDGTKFDSSFDHPDKTPISVAYGEHQVIPGWDTGFGGMRVGGKRRLFIPFQLAYGATAHGPIPPRSPLVFDVELVSVSDTDPTPKPATPAATTRPGMPAGLPGGPVNLGARAVPQRPGTPAPARTPDGTLLAPATTPATAPTQPTGPGSAGAAGQTPSAANPATH